MTESLDIICWDKMEVKHILVGFILSEEMI